MQFPKSKLDALIICPVSHAGECFLQEGFKADSDRIMKDLKRNQAGCQVNLFYSVDSFDFLMVESHATACTLDTVQNLMGILVSIMCSKEYILNPLLCICSCAALVMQWTVFQCCKFF
jgi:hypothetical protein